MKALAKRARGPLPERRRDEGGHRPVPGRPSGAGTAGRRRAGPAPSCRHRSRTTTPRRPRSVPGAGDWTETTAKSRTGPLILLGVLLVAVIIGAILLIPTADRLRTRADLAAAVTGHEPDRGRGQGDQDAGLTVGEVTQEASDTVETGQGRSRRARPRTSPVRRPGHHGRPGRLQPACRTSRSRTSSGTTRTPPQQQLEDLGLKVTLKAKKSDENKDDVLASRRPERRQQGRGRHPCDRLLLEGSAGGAERRRQDLRRGQADPRGRRLHGQRRTARRRVTEPAGTVTQQSPPAGSTQDQDT